MVDKISVIFQGKDYLLLIQYSSGYCEIVKKGEPDHQVKLVHFSELKINQTKKIE